jgi:hypothetical protein
MRCVVSQAISFARGLTTSTTAVFVCVCQRTAVPAEQACPGLHRTLLLVDPQRLSLLLMLTLVMPGSGGRGGTISQLMKTLGINRVGSSSPSAAAAAAAAQMVAQMVQSLSVCACVCVQSEQQAFGRVGARCLCLPTIQHVCVAWAALHDLGLTQTPGFLSSAPSCSCVRVCELAMRPRLVAAGGGGADTRVTNTQSLPACVCECVCVCVCVCSVVQALWWGGATQASRALQQRVYLVCFWGGDVCCLRGGWGERAWTACTVSGVHAARMCLQDVCRVLHVHVYMLPRGCSCVRQSVRQLSLESGGANAAPHARQHPPGTRHLVHAWS